MINRQAKKAKSSIEEIAKTLNLTAPEDRMVAEIIHKHLPKPGGGMMPKNIERGNSAVDRIGKEIAAKCKVEYDGSGMALGEGSGGNRISRAGRAGNGSNDSRRVDMFFVPNEYSVCLKSADKGSYFRQLSLRYKPKEKVFFT